MTQTDNGAAAVLAAAPGGEVETGMDAPLARDSRQRSVVPPEKLAATTAVVVGVGAIGRQVAVQLAAVGVPRMLLVDPDTVGVENLATQGYRPDQVGLPKVLATTADCRALNPGGLATIEAAGNFARSHLKALAVNTAAGGRLAVFCCVDSIRARGFIWSACRDRAGLWVDGRMAAEVCRVLAADDPRDDAYYATTLFAESEAYQGPCTARSTAYCGAVCAGLMVGNFTRWLRGFPVDRDVTLNLLSMDLVCL